MDVCISGNYAYVSASEAGLQIFDISTPAIPTLACTVDTPGIAWHTTVSGNFAYVADHGISGSPNSFIRKINVTNPASATMTDGVDIANSNTDPGTIAIAGNYIYIGYSGDGIRVFYVSPFTHAGGDFNTTGHANGIAISGNSLYVADAASGLQILDISTPGAPSLAKTVSTTNARYVAVSGNYAYVADSTGGLRIIDISTTSAASVVKTITSTGDATNICVDGNVAYVTASDNKIWVVDISVPANATLSSSFTIDGTPSAIAVSNGYLFVAIGSKGFLTIKK